MRVLALNYNVKNSNNKVAKCLLACIIILLLSCLNFENGLYLGDAFVVAVDIKHHLVK